VATKLATGKPPSPYGVAGRGYDRPSHAEASTPPTSCLLAVVDVMPADRELGRCHQTAADLQMTFRPRSLSSTSDGLAAA
jgi:hypothetical protein